MLFDLVDFFVEKFNIVIFGFMLKFNVDFVFFIVIFVSFCELSFGLIV